MNSNGSKKRSKRLGENEILIAGMGGEGVVMVGELLGLAATMDGKFASQRNSYGASQRGEAVCAEIIISDNSIQYPFIESPTHFLSLSQQGFDGYIHRIVDGFNTSIYIDSTQKISLKGLKRKYKVIEFPARAEAIKNKLPLIANIIMLSAFVKHTKIVSTHTLKKVLIKKISHHWLEQNLKAFEIGQKLI